jgi:hypothetical protein
MADQELQVMVGRIWLQGEEVLIPLPPFSENGIRFQVPGLGNRLEIRDHRSVGKSALEAARTEEGAREFHRNFDSPALVTIRADENNLLVELDEPGDSNIETYDMLWVAAQVDKSPPAWPMPWCFRSSPQEGKFSFVAIVE